MQTQIQNLLLKQGMLRLRLKNEQKSSNPNGLMIVRLNLLLLKIHYRLYRRLMGKFHTPVNAR